MNSVSSRWAVTFTCILFLIGQIVLVDHISAQKLITIRGFVLDGITLKGRSFVYCFKQYQYNSVLDFAGEKGMVDIKLYQ